MISLGLYASIGEAWISVLKKIFEEGTPVYAKDEEYTEYKGLCIDIKIGNEADPIIEKYSDPSIISWMSSNFENFQPIKELNYARSYASRLYSYNGVKNQITWVVEKIKKNPITRSATITTFEPLTDTDYVPCVSLLDFDKNDDVLDMYVYARALDLGGKAYANLLCLQKILVDVAQGIECEVGCIHLICKSVHVYRSSYEKMKQIIMQEE